MKKRILIAGIGNIFFGDDAFGVEVIRELRGRHWAEGNSVVQVIDFGIRSYDLAYALTDEYAAIILVDALPRGEAPGTVYLIEPDLGQLSAGDTELPDGHALNPASVLQLAQSIGQISGMIFLAGCEPASLEPGPLTELVRAAIPRALKMIESLVWELLEERGQPACASTCERS
jgi:hydrogenase maturation protease